MSAAPDQYAILMLKPDAVRAGRGDDVRRETLAEGLRIVCSHPLTMPRGLVADLFPECQGDYVLERALMERQYAGEPVEVLLVAGAGAVPRALRVRARLRERFAKGPFANAVHAADEDAEWQSQLAVLAPDCPTCRAAAAGGGTYVRRRLPYVLPDGCRDLDAVSAIVDRLWDDPGSAVWHAGTVPAVPLDQPATHAVILLDENVRMTIDTLAAALLRAVPSLTLPDVVEIVVSAAHVYEFTLATGREATVERVVATLHAFDVAARADRRAGAAQPVG